MATQLLMSVYLNNRKTLLPLLRLAHSVDGVYVPERISIINIYDAAGELVGLEYHYITRDLTILIERIPKYIWGNTFTYSASIIQQFEDVGYVVTTGFIETNNNIPVITQEDLLDCLNDETINNVRRITQ